jgi:hypothetical protein
MMIHLNDLSSKKPHLPQEEQISAQQNNHYKRICPGPIDVICSRSRILSHHSGNTRLRAIIENYLDPYEKAPSKLAKTMIVTEIINTIHSSGGQFLRNNRQAKIWEIASMNLAKEKVGQIFRKQLAERKHERSAMVAPVCDKRRLNWQNDEQLLIENLLKMDLPPDEGLWSSRFHWGDSVDLISNPDEVF